MTTYRTPSYPSQPGAAPRQTLLPVEPDPERPGAAPVPDYVNEDEPEHRTLQVKIRGSARADGRLEQRLVVFCPDSGETRTIDECARCGSFETLALDPRDRSSFLTCKAGEPVRLDSIGSGRWSLATPSQTLPEVSIPEPSARTPVSEVMTKNPITVSPEMSLEGLTLLLLERGLSGVPVVNDAGGCIGVVSKSDLVRHVHERGAQAEDPWVLRSEKRGLELELGAGFHVERMMSATVDDVMTPVTFSVQEDSPIAQAAALMVYEGVHRLPVLSSEGTVAGIVSSLDVLRWVAERSGYLSPGRERT